MTEPQNIDEVILAIQAERPVLVKDKKGQVGNQKTKYADLVQVNDVVLKLLNSMSTIWTCRPHIEAGSFGLHYSLLHVPSRTEKAGVWPLKLSENPQQLGSAVTYGRRYALLAITGIVSEEEDDDGDAASGRRTAQRAAPAGRQASRETQPAGQDRPAAQRARPAAGGPPLPGEPEPVTDPQLQKVVIGFDELGVADRAERLRYTSGLVGRNLGSAKELTKVEASAVIDTLTKAKDEDDPFAFLAANFRTADAQ